MYQLETDINHLPIRRKETMKIGTAQKISTKYPKTTLPTIAPIRAESKVTANAVDLSEIIKVNENYRNNSLIYINIYT